MGVFDQGYEQALIDAAKRPVERPPAGLVETFFATFESVRQEDLTVSEAANLGRHRQQRRELVQELTGEDINYLEGQAYPLLAMEPSALLPSQRRAVTAWREKIQELSSRFPEIRTDEGILADIIEESRRIRQKTEKVLENTTFAGSIGSFTGAMAASLTDPLILSTIPFGASVSAGILRTALTEAGIGALTEAAAQPFIWRYKKQLESPFSLEEAFERVIAAGVGTGLFAGAIKGTAVGARKLLARVKKPRIEGIDDLLDAFNKHVIDPTVLQRDAANVLGEWADVLRDNPFDLGSPVAEARHVEATAKAIADLEAGNPVEVRDIVRGLEPREELRAEDIFEVAGEIKPVVRGLEPREELRAEDIFEVAGEIKPVVRGEIGASVEWLGWQEVPGMEPMPLWNLTRDMGEHPRGSTVSPETIRKLGFEPPEPPGPPPGEGLAPAPITRTLTDPTFERFADVSKAADDAYLPELEAAAKAILDVEDVEVPLVAVERQGELVPLAGREAVEAFERGEGTIIQRSAKELLAEADDDMKAGDILTKCLLGK